MNTINTIDGKDDMSTNCIDKKSLERICRRQREKEKDMSLKRVNRYTWKMVKNKQK